MVNPRLEISQITLCLNSKLLEQAFFHGFVCTIRFALPTNENFSQHETKEDGADEKRSK